MGRGDGRQTSQARADLVAYEAALESYRECFGRYPKSLKDLWDPGPEAGTWRKVRNISLDPFGNPYQYKVPKRGEDLKTSLWSLGPDGLDGTEDDIYLPHRY
jgi:general secretion pathway protein G